MFPTTNSDPRRRESSRAASHEAERGFTLAGLLVILTIMAVVLAYTVPQMWSDVLRRERDLQTIWTMKQYARAIAEFQRRRQALPVSLDQLKEQNRPRVLRRLYPDPLTGQMDWVLIPAGTAVPGAPAPGTTPRQPSWGPPSPQNPNWGQPGAGGTSGGGAGSGDEGRSTSTSATGQPVQAANQIGPFIGVRPPKTGRSFVAFKGIDRYENWSYTVLDLQAEQNQAIRPPGAGMPTSGTPPTGTKKP